MLTEPVQCLAQGLFRFRIVGQLGLEARRKSRADQNHFVEQDIQRDLGENRRVSIASADDRNRRELVAQRTLPWPQEAIADPLQKRLEATVGAVGMHDGEIEHRIGAVQPRHQLPDVVLHLAVLVGTGVVGVAVIDPVILEPDVIDRDLLAQVAAHQRHHPCTDTTRSA